MAIQDPLRYHTHFRMDYLFLQKKKKIIVIVIEIALYLHIAFGGMDILTVKTLHTHKHGLCVNLFMFNFFQQYFTVFIVQVFHIFG